MVDFEDYYSFPADQVESVEVSTKSEDDCPYVLRVWLRSGRSLAVSYRDKGARDRVKQILCSRIDRELHQNDEQILNRLMLLQDVVRRIDGRQLRIWRQLKRLLHIEEEIAP